MTLSLTARSRRRARNQTVATGWRLALQAKLVVGTLVLLASCGGGTSQFEPFAPQRLVVFGDELSTLTPDGRKYAVNGLNALGGIDCSAEPLWVQVLANYYGFVFAECNPTGATRITAVMRAAPGAKVAEVAAQVEAQNTATGFRSNDLVLVMAGMNDILALYAQFPQRSEAALTEEARASGERMALTVNRLIDLQARIIVSTLPDLGLSPFARAEAAANPGRAGLLTRLSTAFNERLGVKVVLDGRYVGLMQTDLRSQLLDRFPGSFPPVNNITQAVCTAALPNCTTATLVQGGNASAYYWADGTRLSTGGQSQLAQLALERAQRNPF